MDIKQVKAVEVLGSAMHSQGTDGSIELHLMFRLEDGRILTVAVPKSEILNLHNSVRGWVRR